MVFTYGDLVILKTREGWECRALAEKKWPISFLIPESYLPEILSEPDRHGRSEEDFILSLFQARIHLAIRQGTRADDMLLGGLLRGEIGGLVCEARSADGIFA
jgi:hypothetical protein